MSPERSIPPRLQGITLLLVGCASIVTQAVICDPRESWLVVVGTAVGFSVLAAVGNWGMQRYRCFDGPRPSWPAVVILLGAVAPWLFEPLMRLWFATGRPFEILGLASLQGLALTLAAFSGWEKPCYTAGIVSGFLVLFGYCLAEQSWLAYVLAIYTAVVCYWLLLLYWQKLFPQAEQRVPLGLVVFLGLFALSLVVLADVAPKQWSTVLAEVMPSSGGSGQRDPFARGGLGDGDHVTSGEDPQSAGADSEVFIESHERTFYDAVNDQFGEPYKPRNHQRAIALSPQDIAGHERAKNNQARRQFSTTRQRPNTRKRPRDLEANALLSVQGPVPLHLPMKSYDVFDGIDWYEEPDRNHFANLQPMGNHWLQLTSSPRKYHAGDARHTILVGKLQTQIIPLPRHWYAFRIGLADRSDFYRWGQDGILRLQDDRARFPPGEQVQSLSRSVDYQQLADISYTGLRESVWDQYRTGAEEVLSPEAQQLIRSWVEGQANDWARVQAVIQRLRNEYTLDRTAVVSQEATNVLDDFLLKQKRGPEYLFATSAAMSLRLLGYPTRLVNGYYANPQRYDAFTRNTSVVVEDLHTWVEIRLPNGDWVTLEPCPGYQVLPAQRTWQQFFSDLAWGTGVWIWNARWLLLLASLVVVLVYRYRVILLDNLCTRWGRLVTAWPGNSVASNMRWILWTIEVRAWLLRVPRPPGKTLRQWYLPRVSSNSAAVQRFFDLVDQTFYQENRAGVSREELQTLFAEVLQALSRTALRNAERNTTIQPSAKLRWQHSL